MQGMRMRLIVTDVAWSVCLSACVCVSLFSKIHGLKN